MATNPKLGRREWGHHTVAAVQPIFGLEQRGDGYDPSSLENYDPTKIALDFIAHYLIQGQGVLRDAWDPELDGREGGNVARKWALILAVRHGQEHEMPTQQAAGDLAGALAGFNGHPDHAAAWVRAIFRRAQQCDIPVKIHHH
jgi:hypothetical protein